MNQKVDIFFELLHGVYGVAKMQANWPTEKDLQVGKALWAADINKHNEQELRGAIENAKSQMKKGDSDFMWPNIGAILSGARRVNCGAHKLLLQATEKTKEQRKQEREFNLNNLASLRASTGI